MKRKTRERRVKCQCGHKFLPDSPDQELCLPCLRELEHDANVTMFGDDADYLEIAGLADEIGNH